MTPIARTLLAAVLLLVGMSTASGQEPETGRVLLLKNERILQGEIERHGSQYRLRRDIGETWVEADKVLCLCADLDSAYQQMRKTANLRDPDERMRLARWCHAHGLKQRAIEEAEAVLHYRPEDDAALRLARGLKRIEDDLPTGASPSADVDRPAPGVELPSEAMASFASKVQPILMNTCLSCHVGPDTAFRLTRGHGMLNRRALQANVATAMKFVQRGDQWANSPLLTKAITAHGGIPQAPLKSKSSPAYKTLEEWVRLAADAPMSEVKDAATPTEPLPGKPVGQQLEAVRPTEVKAPMVVSSDGSNPPEPVKPIEEVREPEQAVPNDPYDPELFNRQNPGR